LWSVSAAKIKAGGAGGRTRAASMVTRLRAGREQAAAA